jgi:hypothetical protein
MRKFLILHVSGARATVCQIFSHAIPFYSLSCRYSIIRDFNVIGLAVYLIHFVSDKINKNKILFSLTYQIQILIRTNFINLSDTKMSKSYSVLFFIG